MKPIMIITGAGSGLGAALAHIYMSNGAHVCLLGRSEDKLLRAIEGVKGSYSVYEVDVRNFDEVHHVICTIEKEHGAIDMLINNAGVGFFGEAEAISPEATSQMFDTNVKGTIYTTQAVLPQMKKENKGTVVNIISTAGRQGKANESVYCASKFAVRGFTESLQEELKETSIRISGIYMGGMDTPFWDNIFSQEQRAKMMRPHDVAEIIYANLEERPQLSVEEIVIRNKK